MSEMPLSQLSGAGNAVRRGLQDPPPRVPLLRLQVHDAGDSGVVIQERTKAGLAAARARGRNGGRPKVTSEEAEVVLAKKLHADKSLEIDDICKTLRISRSTFIGTHDGDGAFGSVVPGRILTRLGIGRFSGIAALCWGD